MEKSMDVEKFVDKFGKLTVNNQRYIIAIQQALLFAQSSEGKNEKKDILKGMENK